MPKSIEQLEQEVASLRATLDVIQGQIGTLAQGLTLSATFDSDAMKRAASEALSNVVVQAAVAALMASHPNPDQLHTDFQRIWQSMRGPLGAPEAEGEIAESAAAVFGLFQRYLPKPIL